MKRFFLLLFALSSLVSCGKMASLENGIYKDATLVCPLRGGFVYRSSEKVFITLYDEELPEYMNDIPLPKDAEFQFKENAGQKEDWALMCEWVAESLFIHSFKVKTFRQDASRIRIWVEGVVNQQNFTIYYDGKYSKLYDYYI